LIDNKVTSVQKTLQLAKSQQPPPNTNQNNLTRMRRILSEMQSYQKNPHPSIQIFPTESNIAFWRMLLVGPEGTPYENGVFLLYTSFPDNYPNAAPEIRFTTPIYHCNINNYGKICHSVFDRNWTTDTTISTVLSSIYGLLLAPEPDDPLDSTLAEEYFADRRKYEANARQHALTHASKKSLEAWKRELLGEEGDQPNLDNSVSIPDHLLCPITKDIFKNPVTTKYGHTYEKAQIEEWVNRNHNDPLTKQPLTLQDLFPNIAIRKACEEFKQKQAQTTVDWWN